MNKKRLKKKNSRPLKIIERAINEFWGFKRILFVEIERATSKPNKVKLLCS